MVRLSVSKLSPPSRPALFIGAPLEGLNRILLFLYWQRVFFRQRGAGVAPHAWHAALSERCEKSS